MCADARRRRFGLATLRAAGPGATARWCTGESGIALRPPEEAHDQDDTGFQVCSRGQSAHFAEKRSVCGSVRLDDPSACAPVSWSEGSCSARPGHTRVTERFRTASGALSSGSARILTGSTQLAAKPVRTRQVHRTGDPGSALVASLVPICGPFSVRPMLIKRRPLVAAALHKERASGESAPTRWRSSGKRRRIHKECCSAGPAARRWG